MDKKQFKDLYRKTIKIETVYCCICGLPIKNIKDLTVEHEPPQSRQEELGKSKLYPSHAKCNHRKGALTMDEYRQWLELERKRHGEKQK